MTSLAPSTRKNSLYEKEKKTHKKKTSSKANTELVTTLLEDMQEKRPATAVLVEALDDEIDKLDYSGEDNSSNRGISSKSPKKIRNVARKKLTEKEFMTNDFEDEKNSIVEFKDKKSEPQTPSSSQTLDKKTAKLVTPSTSNSEISDEKENVSVQKRRNDTASARRSLLPPLQEISALSQNEIDRREQDKQPKDEMLDKPKKIVGTELDAQEKILESTKNVYKIVQKMTGKIGGNGHGGAIYGELTLGSMQKMVELMKKYTDFNKGSRFIDVGCGLGKPNLHVAQDPQVEFSYGIEMEHVRWMLGLSNLKEVFRFKKKQELRTKNISPEKSISHRCYLAHGDITEANFFDPFTHVYMFDIGFPPKLFKQLAKMFNQSQSPWLICYHGPKLMVERYGFDVELIVQMQTTMFGSGEGHEGYLYKRVEGKKKSSKKTKKCPTGGAGLPRGVPCDPLFANAWRTTKGDFDTYSKQVEADLNRSLCSGRPRRNRKPVINDPYVSACKQ